MADDGEGSADIYCNAASASIGAAVFQEAIAIYGGGEALWGEPGFLQAEYVNIVFFQDEEKFEHTQSCDVKGGDGNPLFIPTL